ncbi:MAG: aldose 1-epimerase family protein [Erysipelotrichaceae bacterium]|nr:aldose 1-epimerase family protein [Erysipelotrichaceae bacterium]
MKYTIKNEFLTLDVDTKAAEMHSLKRNDDDYEYLWQGDPKYWAGRNPTLFPQVSSTPTKTNILYGKEYPMGNHGFARNSEFELVEVKDKELTLVLKDNEETRKQYPYSYELFITYTLKEDLVDITYKIVNKNEEVMPFGFGLHPAFNCPLDYKDTVITMDDKEELVISEELFKQYPTYIYHPNTFSKAVLKTNNHALEVDFKGYTNLAIWSPFGPFVCIEPWMCLPAQLMPGVDFEKREEYIHLPANEVFTISHQIKPLGKI